MDGDVVLVLRPLPDGVPEDARLRRLLKAALREYKFRAVRVGDAPVEVQDLTHDGVRYAEGGADCRGSELRDK
jgi:hypothetical protein